MVSVCLRDVLSCASMKSGTLSVLMEPGLTMMPMWLAGRQDTLLLVCIIMCILLHYIIIYIFVYAVSYFTAAY